jgi:hypothetical protein
MDFLTSWQGMLLLISRSKVAQTYGCSPFAAIRRNVARLPLAKWRLSDLFALQSTWRPIVFSYHNTILYIIGRSKASRVNSPAVGKAVNSKEGDQLRTVADGLSPKTA